MDILITPTSSRSAAVSASSTPKANQSVAFNDLLTGLIAKAKPQQIPTAPAEPVILVGEITPENQTVSELLIQHAELKNATWDIIHSEQNQNKAYNKIQPGTLVYYNTEDGLLTWSNTDKESSPAERTAASTHPCPPLAGPSIENSRQDAPQKNNISLGVISDSNTTAFQLLKNHQQLEEHTGNLLAASMNRGKPFDHIANGTERDLNTENMQITWGVADTSTQVAGHAARAVEEALRPNVPAPEHTSPATDLSEAVRKYFGTSYKEINCYELLVKGLQHMDIPYAGRDGLFTKLTHMAVDRGMAPNAYLNGEGIVKAAGSLVLSKNYSGSANWRDQAATLISEIDQLLDKGQILSFSTEKRGHTGIISQQNNQWTFINSGRLDHSVDLNSVHRGVGEENLHEEIRNWFKLAHAKGESLSVTLGQLEQGKIRTAFNMSESLSERS